MFDVNSLGFWGAAYNQVIIFREEEDFNTALSANGPRMEAIIGRDERTRRNFPGVYVAGIKSNLHRDYMEDHPAATQK